MGKSASLGQADLCVSRANVYDDGGVVISRKEPSPGFYYGLTA
jgi:hypothetical protein